MLPWSAWADLGVPVLVFTVGVLVLRRLPVVLAMRPLLGLDHPTAAFYGYLRFVDQQLFRDAHAQVFDPGSVDGRARVVVNGNRVDLPAAVRAQGVFVTAKKIFPADAS